MNHNTSQSEQTKPRYRMKDHAPILSDAQHALLKRILPDKPLTELERMPSYEARRVISQHIQSGLPLPPSKKQIGFLRCWGLWNDEKPLDSKQAHAIIGEVKKKTGGLSPEEASKQSESSRLAGKGDSAGIPILTREEVEGIFGKQ